MRAEPVIETVDTCIVDIPMKRPHVMSFGAPTEVNFVLVRVETRGGIVAFLNEVMNLDLTAEDIAALEERTEGWIAGLQMAALSLQGRDDRSSFVRAFTGSHRFVLDYLIEEVLDRQTPATQDFLLKTSILEQMTASLCEAVTGEANGQATLLKLERSNLFVVPLDDERRWYRYHHLFRDLLRARLIQTRPDLVPALQQRAPANGMPRTN